MIPRAFMAAVRKLKLSIEDVFATKTYSGSGSSNVISTGIDLTRGGLVITKRRNGTNGWAWLDTARGTNQLLSSETNNSQNSVGGISAVSTTGYTLAYSGSSDNSTNNSGGTYAAWVFRKSSKFFDVKTFTASNGLQVTHDLGTTPGCIMFKRTDTSDNWRVWHKDLSSGNMLFLNSSAAYSYYNTISNVDGAKIQIATDGNSFVSGSTYIAYFFAHDTTTDGIIRCGKYTGTSTKFDQYYYSDTTISIPAGVSSVKVTVQGGDGWATTQQGNSSYPSGLPPYQAAADEYFAPGANWFLADWAYDGNPYWWTHSSFGYSGGVYGEANFRASCPSGRGASATIYRDNPTTGKFWAISSDWINRNPYVTSDSPAYAPAHGEIGNSSYPSGLPAYSPATAQYGNTTTATLNGNLASSVGGYGAGVSATTTITNLAKDITQSQNLAITSTSSQNGYVRVEYYYNGSGSVNLGWEPQWLLAKSVSTVGDWQLIDNSRGADYPLLPNNVGAELNFDAIDISSTGFTTKAGALSRSDDDYIYIAIRKGPMR